MQPSQKREEKIALKGVPLSSLNNFYVSRRVHQCSWGNRRNSMKSKENILWSSSDFTIHEMIGKGHFGNISRAQYKTKGSEISNVVALKRFSKSSIIASQKEGGRTIQLLKREVNIHSHLNHPNILSFFGFYEDRRNISLVLEYALHGDLLNYMMRVSEHDRANSARHILWQTAQALQYLESVQVAHRDIKPENILIMKWSETNRMTVKLCDFGWAVWFKPGNRRSTLCGTAEYCPPEMLMDRRSYHAEYIDRWMFGVLAYELIHNRTPFRSQQTSNNLCHNNIFENIRSFKDLTVDDKNGVNEEFLNFASCFMKVKPEDRYSAEQATTHNFLRPKEHDGPEVITPPRPSVAQLRQIFLQN